MVIYGMRKKLNVICIDGILGSGKSTQINMIRNLLKKEGVESKIFEFNTDVSSDEIKKTLLSIEKYIKENENSIALCDGSIASFIANQQAQMIDYNNLLKNNSENIQIYEDLNTRLNFVNFIMQINNESFIQDRMDKKSKLLGLEAKKIENIEHLRLLNSAISNFKNLPFNWNIKFNILDIDKNDSILDIHRNIKDILTQNYQIIKPS